MILKKKDERIKCMNQIGGNKILTILDIKIEQLK